MDWVSGLGDFRKTFYQYQHILFLQISGAGEEGDRQHFLIYFFIHAISNVDGQGT